MSSRFVTIDNDEQLDDYRVRWPREFRELAPGMTAVLRVRNEARSLPWVLPSLFRALQGVVLVDNQSTDGTADVARRVAAELGASDRLLVTDYPFQVSRCGAEHLATPEHSVHNLAYFYNWSFAHVQTAYSMKWDGDMVLTVEGENTFADLSWQLENVEAVVSMPRHPLFVESDRVAYLDRYMINMEEYIFPMGQAYRHVKAYEWEMRMVPKQAQRMRLPEGLCVELKYLDSDEFDHWDSQDLFGATPRTMRKLREWEVFHALREGRVLEGVERIEAPASYDHVISYTTERWLPAQVRPITVPLDQRPGAELIPPADS
ncbi:glycosyltransferase [Nocardioides mangrovi]|uniref:Glycosyltransferase family 2 protein n=1 Tax=Nocardioides mangrovi TaxID=2874580 RepID=A0ABS7UE08_9ACTN|nr:glycosyltransferase [Nocardioides mangrovi]MBZ5739240.1 glycosyltransferase family 2 protein [Nocardioides mangrovi]